jgi:hypothetical protein
MSPEEEGREEAARISKEFPCWMVLYGAFSRQLVAFPLFPVPPGMVVVAASYPPALTDRMQRIEKWCNLRRVRDGLMCMA